MTTNKTLLSLTLITLVAALGCGDDSAPVDSGTDTSTPPADSGMDTSTPPTDSGMDSTVADSGTDGGMTGFSFRSDMPSAYTRVDRMGMPAVATALIPSGKKDEYNSVDPSDDFATSAGATCADLVSCRWAGDYVASISAIHGLTNAGGMTLNEQLTGLGLTPCTDGGACATQFISGTSGPVVANLVIPDVLTIDTTATAGFPNGRKLSDPAMDVTLAVLLLDLSVHNPGTFTDLDGDGTPGPSLNPLANDVAFGTTFPYVADPHTAP